MEQLLVGIQLVCGADVVEISSSDDEGSDIELLASDDNEVDEADDGEAEMIGSYVNDALNQLDSSGRVLVNIGHPPDELDIFLPFQIAAAVKPHQVCWLVQPLVARGSNLSVSQFGTLVSWWKQFDVSVSLEPSVI